MYDQGADAKVAGWYRVFKSCSVAVRFRVIFGWSRAWVKIKRGTVSIAWVHTRQKSPLEKVDLVRRRVNRQEKSGWICINADG